MAEIWHQFYTGKQPWDDLTLLIDDELQKEMEAKLIS